MSTSSNNVYMLYHERGEYSDHAKRVCSVHSSLLDAKKAMFLGGQTDLSIVECEMDADVVEGRRYFPVDGKLVLCTSSYYTPEKVDKSFVDTLNLSEVKDGALCYVIYHTPRLKQIKVPLQFKSFQQRIDFFSYKNEWDRERGDFDKTFHDLIREWLKKNHKELTLPDWLEITVYSFDYKRSEKPPKTFVDLRQISLPQPMKKKKFRSIVHSELVED